MVYCAHCLSSVWSIVIVPIGVLPPLPLPQDYLVGNNEAIKAAVTSVPYLDLLATLLIDPQPRPFAINQYAMLLRSCVRSALRARGAGQAA